MSSRLGYVAAGGEARTRRAEEMRTVGDLTGSMKPHGAHWPPITFFLQIVIVSDDNLVLGQEMHDELSTKRDETESSGISVISRSAKNICVQYPTLNAAIKALSSGDILLIEPGRYEVKVPLIVDANDVVITSSDADEAKDDSFRGVSLAANFNAAILQIKGWNVRVRGISFENGIRTETCKINRNLLVKLCSPIVHAPCLVVTSGDAMFEYCSFSTGGTAAIVVSGPASPRFEHCTLQRCADCAILIEDTAAPIISRCLVRDGAGYGIVARDDAGGSVEDSEVTGNERAALVALDRATITFARNHVHHGAQGAFWLLGSSRCVVRANRARANGRTHLQVSDDADPLVEGNWLCDGHGGGVVVHDRAAGSFCRNVVRGNRQAGIGVMDTASPVFVDNDVVRNRAGGVVLAGECQPTFDRNVIAGNGVAGVGVKEMARPRFERNLVRENEGCGFLIQGGRGGSVQANTVEDNGECGVCCSEGSCVQLHGNLVCSGRRVVQRIGILVRDQARAALADNDVHGHALCGVVLRDASAAALEHNQVWGGGSAGLVVQDRARATADANELRDNAIANLVVMDDAQMHGEANAICDSPGTGALFLGRAGGLMRHNHLLRNQQAGARCAGESAPRLEGNHVSGATRGYGVVVQGGSCAALARNLVHGNLLAAVAVRAGAAPDVCDNVLVADGPPPPPGSPAAQDPAMGAALLLESGAGGTCEGNHLQARAGGAARVAARATARVCGNVVWGWDSADPRALLDAAAGLCEPVTVPACLLVVGPDPADPPCLAVPHGVLAVPQPAQEDHTPPGCRVCRAATGPRDEGLGELESWVRGGSPEICVAATTASASPHARGDVSGTPAQRGGGERGGCSELLECCAGQLAREVEVLVDALSRDGGGTGGGGRRDVGERWLAALLLTRWQLTQGGSRERGWRPTAALLAGQLSARAALERAREMLQGRRISVEGGEVAARVVGLLRQAAADTHAAQLSPPPPPGVAAVDGALGRWEAVRALEAAEVWVALAAR